MIKVKRIPGRKYTSNVYLISEDICPGVFYMIDCGCIEDLLKMSFDFSELKGIFLTHAHYDHIEGLKFVLDKYPNLPIYCSEYTAESISDPRLNLSFYHENPLSFNVKNLHILQDGEKVPVFNGYEIEVISTPGHDVGCSSFLLDRFCFSGDSLIPNIPVVTKLRTGNKSQSFQSISRIKLRLKKNSVVCPGHVDMVEASEVNWSIYE